MKAFVVKHVHEIPYYSRVRVQIFQRGSTNIYWVPTICKRFLLITSLVGFSSQTWLFFPPSKFYTSGQIWLSKVGEKEQSHYRITYLWILRSTKRNPPSSSGDKHFIIEMFKNQPSFFFFFFKGSLFVSSRLSDTFPTRDKGKKICKGVSSEISREPQPLGLFWSRERQQFSSWSRPQRRLVFPVPWVRNHCLQDSRKEKEKLEGRVKKVQNIVF